MGVVYRARDPIINRLVALKTITAGIANDPNLLQRFYREAQSAGGLQHPNIVTVYDMGDEGGVPFIAMELVDGESLEHLIARRSDLPVSLSSSMRCRPAGRLTSRISAALSTAISSPPTSWSARKAL